MAKVKIQGNASGTGVLTVTAPNTSTDRTITLPDSTGSLIADDGSGNVGIGMTPTQKLEVNGGIALPTTQLLRWNNSGTIAGSIGVDNSNNMILYNTEYNTERMRILAGGGITFNGDTSAANALDDYEEGSGNSSQIDVKVGGTASSVSGVGYKYTKIGNIVHFQFEFQLTNLNGASSGTFSVGLPFTAVNGGYSAGALRIYNGAVDGNEFIALDSNANDLYLARRVNNSGTANVTASNNAYYFGQLTYTTS